jgi:1-phosphofructokinase family hexose kinase
MVRLERLPVDGKPCRAGFSSYSAGGKGINVARALSCLGVPVRASFLCGGTTGLKLSAILAEEGIGLVPYPVRGRTRINTTMVDDQKKVARVLARGPRVSGRFVLQYGDFLEKWMAPAGLVVFSGSLPPGAPADVYARLVERARLMGKRVALDTSGEAFILGKDARPYLIKPNREEAEAAWGERIRSRRSMRKALQYFSGCGIKKVLVSLGGDGLAATDGRQFLLARGPREPGHTVGCGDSLLAGYIAGEAEELSFRACLRRAVACGAANVGAGTPGGIVPGQVRERSREIKLTEL